MNTIIQDDNEVLVTGPGIIRVSQHALVRFRERLFRPTATKDDLARYYVEARFLRIADGMLFLHRRLRAIFVIRYIGRETVIVTCWEANEEDLMRR